MSGFIKRSPPPTKQAARTPITHHDVALLTADQLPLLLRSMVRTTNFSDPLSSGSNHMDMVQSRRIVPRASSRSRPSSDADTVGMSTVTCIFPKLQVKVPDELLASADDEAIKAYVWSRCQDSMRNGISILASALDSKKREEAPTLVESEDYDDLSLTMSNQSRTSRHSRASGLSRDTEYVRSCCFNALRRMCQTCCITNGMAI